MRYTILHTKFLHIVLIIMVSLNLVCCSKLKEDSTLPDDFYFIIEGGSSLENLKPLIDTKNKKIGRDLFINFEKVDYNISDVDLNDIYKNIIKYNIKNLNSDTMYKPENQCITPQYCYKLEFRINNILYSIIYDNSLKLYENKKMRDLLQFHEYIIEFYTSTDEYKNLPEPSVFPR